MVRWAAWTRRSAVRRRVSIYNQEVFWICWFGLFSWSPKCLLLSLCREVLRSFRRAVTGVYPYHGLDYVAGGRHAEIFRVRRGKLLAAIKRPKRPADRHRIARESRFLEVARHPNVVSRLAYCSDFASYALMRSSLVMQWISGCSLRALLRRWSRIGHRPTPAQLADLACQLCGALAFLQRLGRGVVHGDIGPQNIMIDCTGRLKLIDFGSAFWADEAAPAGPGTLGYLAPEVFCGGTASPASDQFSAGVLLWEVANLRRAFPMNDLSAAGALEVVDWPAYARGGYPLDLLTTIQRMLRLQPSGRFAELGTAARAFAMDHSAEQRHAAREQLGRAVAALCSQADFDPHDRRLGDALVPKVSAHEPTYLPDPLDHK